MQCHSLEPDRLAEIRRTQRNAESAPLRDIISHHHRWPYPILNVPRSVISAKVKLALRWRSTLSEKTRVLNALRGSPEKKSVSPRYVYRMSLGTWSSRELNIRFLGIGEGQLRPLSRSRPRPVRRDYRVTGLKVNVSQDAPALLKDESAYHRSMWNKRHPSLGAGPAGLEFINGRESKGSSFVGGGVR